MHVMVVAESLHLDERVPNRINKTNKKIVTNNNITVFFLDAKIIKIILEISHNTVLLPLNSKYVKMVLIQLLVQNIQTLSIANSLM